MAIFLDYFLVKNFAFTFCQFWFGIFCLWSAQSVYEDMMIASYNVVYTSIPVLILAIMDKDVNERSSLKNPSLYKLGPFLTLIHFKKYQIFCKIYIKNYQNFSKIIYFFNNLFFQNFFQKHKFFFKKYKIFIKKYEIFYSFLTKIQVITTHCST